MGAEGFIAMRLVYRYTMSRHKPLAVLIQQGNQRNGRACHPRGQTCNGVKCLFRRAIKNLQFLKLGQAQSFLRMQISGWNSISYKKVHCMRYAP